MTMVIAPGAPFIDMPMVLWNDAFGNGDITATSELPDGSPLNVADGNTFDYWRPATANSSITSTFSARTIDSVGLAAHNLHMVGATVRADISVSGSWVSMGSISPVDGDPILFIFPPVLGAAIRLVLTSATGAAIGVVMGGGRLVFPTDILSGYSATNHSKTYKLMNNSTMNGQRTGTRVLRTGIRTNVTFGLLDRTFCDGPLVGFKDHYDKGRAFFYAGSPSKMPLDMAYSWRPEQGGEMSVSYADPWHVTDLPMDIEAYVAP